MPGPPRIRDCGNYLLDRLPSQEYDALSPAFERVSLTLRQVVYQFESEIEFVHFPITALVSILTVLEEDDPVEAATIGREGFVGNSAVLGCALAPDRAICQMKGETIRIAVPPFLNALGRSSELTRLIHHYLAYSFRNSNQGIACNALHQIEARACRWLLMIHDQAGRDEFPMTQEFLAFILGVRRQGVTVVAGTLQSAGLIAYRRGTITVLDRSRLEEAACECYASLRNYYERILS